MKANASLGDLAGLCKLFGGLKGINMAEKSGGHLAASASGMKALEGMIS